MDRVTLSSTTLNWYASIPLVTWAIGAAFIIVLLIALQRLYIHPLRAIPGPRLAALTSWYECYYDVYRPGQYAFKIAELHKSYGPIIRISPDEVHISDVGYLEEIYRKKDRRTPPNISLLVPQSVGAANDLETHKVRRDALNPFFVQRRILDLEPLLRAKARLLGAAFKEAKLFGNPINLSDVYFAYSNE